MSISRESSWLMARLKPRLHFCDSSGHRFVSRRLRRKARLADVPYEPRATDAVLEVGPTNDLVVVDGELRLTVHNARYRAREAVAGALRARDPVAALRGAVAGGLFSASRSNSVRCRRVARARSSTTPRWTATCWRSSASAPAGAGGSPI